MSKLFNEIDEALNHIRHGWCTTEKAYTLASVILALKPEVVCEIGIWAGRSLIPMALAVRHNRIGKVIGIDPWSADASSSGMSGANLQWWSSVPHEDIYNHFISAVHKFGVSQVVDIRRAKSDDVDPPQNIGLFHCDGNHSDQAIRDIERFAPNVKAGGFVFCDDIQWDGGGVSKATHILDNLGFIEPYKLDTGAMYQRVYV